jgi:hypothetical protein
MYTHFASRFLENGRLNGRFKILMQRLSKMNGWFVPVTTLLDYILHARGSYDRKLCMTGSKRAAYS